MELIQKEVESSVCEQKSLKRARPQFIAQALYQIARAQFRP